MFKRQAVRIAVLVALFIVAPVLRAEAAGNGGNPTVSVMTMNMYVGTDVNSALLSAQTPSGLALAVTAAYQNILNSDPPERIAAMAKEIASHDPDLVGLQEVALLRTAPITSPPTFATKVEADFLQMLLDDLTQLGQHYNAVAILPGIDAQAPTTLGKVIRLTARTAIIARTGLSLSNIHVEDFLANLRVPVPISPGAITDTRGWISVDADLGGPKIRFFTTHLENATPAPLAPIQLAQAKELVAVATHTSLPVIMAADFNANADNPADPSFRTYTLLRNAGFADAWTQVHPDDPGYTCCQAPDLRNPVSQLSERIDLVLYRGALQAVEASLAGNQPSDRTPSGLWPSDHAAVEATFAVGSPQTAQPQP
ncbi:MAG TPA: endonuclease/exonuclease/phosphatase family protein [Stellaceae bacterium]|nr:endonuclease/exonuclease/phosphatase family protein [Stellaceae bacterium]